MPGHREERWLCPRWAAQLLRQHVLGQTPDLLTTALQPDFLPEGQVGRGDTPAAAAQCSTLASFPEDAISPQTPPGVAADLPTGEVHSQGPGRGQEGD